MKTLLALLISCIPLFAATTYPVITDNSNRTFPGGVTNVFFLNSNAVAVGTLRVTGAVTLTNSGNVFAGDGSGLTGISSYTNLANGANTVLATNLVAYSSGTTNRPLAVIGGTQTNENGVLINSTVNNAALDFAGLMIDVTNSASSSYSWLSMRSNGVEKAAIKMVSGRAYIDTGLGWLLGQQFITGDYFGMSANQLGFGASFGNGFGIRSGWMIRWSSGADATYGHDVGLERVSAGVLGVNSGTSGEYRDLVARSIYATNAYVTNLIVNGGATVTKILSATASLNFDLSAVTVEDLTITVTGAATGDVVSLGVPNGSVTTSVQYTAWVSAADTVTVRARTSASGEDPASGTFRATVIKH